MSGTGRLNGVPGLSHAVWCGRVDDMLSPGDLIQLFLITKAALKVMPLILLFWLTPSEVDVGSMAVEAEHSTNTLSLVVAMWQMAAEVQSDKMLSDMEIHMKQTCAVEFFRVDKVTPIDTQHSS